MLFRSSRRLPRAAKDDAEPISTCCILGSRDGRPNELRDRRTSHESHKFAPLHCLSPKAQATHGSLSKVCRLRYWPMSERRHSRPSPPVMLGIRCPLRAGSNRTSLAAQYVAIGQKPTSEKGMLGLASRRQLRANRRAFVARRPTISRSRDAPHQRTTKARTSC